MATWRRKALALFPDLRRDLQRPDFSVYMLFFELLPNVRQAHQEGDADALRRIHGFAAWCAEQNAKDLWNAAGVAFYEHLFDSHRSLWGEFVRWLPPRVLADCRALWEARLSVEDLAEIRRLVAERREPRYAEARQMEARQMFESA
ncbi:MAG TPA: hypothetical protein VFW87_11830 [Pirellulales bacterium]|nr:hypothetical protein [Pirellulales bacterium]